MDPGSVELRAEDLEKFSSTTKSKAEKWEADQVLACALTFAEMRDVKMLCEYWAIF